MNDKYKLLQESPQHCQRLFGVKYELFEKLIGIVQNHIAEKNTKNPMTTRGVKANFSLENQVLLTLEYLRQYPTFISLSFSYGISEGYCNKIFHKISAVLAQEIGLKNHHKLKFSHVQKIIVDVTAQPVERPQQHQERQYNGYKKNT